MDTWNPDDYETVEVYVDDDPKSELEGYVLQNKKTGTWFSSKIWCCGTCAWGEFTRVKEGKV